MIKSLARTPAFTIPQSASRTAPFTQVGLLGGHPDLPLHPKGFPVQGGGAGLRPQKGKFAKPPAEGAAALRIQGPGMQASRGPVAKGRGRFCRPLQERSALPPPPPAYFRQRFFSPMIKPGAMAYGPRRQERRLGRGAHSPAQGKRKPGPIIHGAGRLLRKVAGTNQGFPPTSARAIAVRVAP